MRGLDTVNVLVATARTQGERGNDFFWCVEGELVHFGVVCARDRRDPDGGCGCGRALAGLFSHRATTTAEVRDLRLTRADVVEALRSSLEQQGYDPTGADAEAGVLLGIATSWPVGTVVERRLDQLRARLPGGTARVS
jgi:hypothetical protein